MTTLHSRLCMWLYCFVCLMPGNCSSFQQGKKITLTPFCVTPRRQRSLCVKYLSLWHLDLPFKDDIFQNWHFFICFLEATKLFFDIPVSVFIKVCHLSSLKLFGCFVVHGNVDIISWWLKLFSLSDNDISVWWLYLSEHHLYSHCLNVSFINASILHFKLKSQVCLCMSHHFFGCVGRDWSLASARFICRKKKKHICCISVIYMWHK